MNPIERLLEEEQMVRTAEKAVTREEVDGIHRAIEDLRDQFRLLLQRDIAPAWRHEEPPSIITLYFRTPEEPEQPGWVPTSRTVVRHADGTYEVLRHPSTAATQIPRGRAAANVPDEIRNRTVYRGGRNEVTHDEAIDILGTGQGFVIEVERRKGPQTEKFTCKTPDQLKGVLDAIRG